MKQVADFDFRYESGRCFQRPQTAAVLATTRGRHSAVVVQISCADVDYLHRRRVDKWQPVVSLMGSGKLISVRSPGALRASCVPTVAFSAETSRESDMIAYVKYEALIVCARYITTSFRSKMLAMNLI